MLSRSDALSRYSAAVVVAASNVVLPDISRSGLEDVILCKKVLMAPKQVSPNAKVTSPKVSLDGMGPATLGNGIEMETGSPPRSNDRLTQCSSPVKRIAARTGTTPPSSASAFPSKHSGISLKSTDMLSQTMPLRSLSAHDGSRDSNMLSKSVNAIRKSSIPKPTNGLRRSIEKISALESSQISNLLIPTSSASVSAARRIGSESAPTIKTLNLASIDMSTHHKSTKPDNESQSGQSMSSDGSANSKAVNTLTSNVDAVSFQQACKNRVAKQKKELSATLSTNAGPQGFSAKEARASIREASAARAEEAQKRKRAEIYAINRYLGAREKMRYEAFLVEQERQLQEDEVSWCSADSSLMPTPRYRSEKERRYDNTTPTKDKTKSIGGV